MMVIQLAEFVGSFAENKDIARDIRKEKIVPALEKNEDVALDFLGIQSTTQSFVHALISELFREYGTDVLDKVSFKNCNEVVKKIVAIVVEYMQQG